MTTTGLPPSDQLDLGAAVSGRERARRRNQRALETLADEAGRAPRGPRVRAPSARWARAEWGLIPTLAVAAFLLILLGDGNVDRDDPFEAVGAFTSGFPSEYDEAGLWVTLGRTLAPVVAIWATLRLVMVLYAQRIREWRVRRRRGHTIVVGLGETGLRAVHELRRNQQPVVAVTQEPFGVPADSALYERAYVVAGSGIDGATLHAAGLGGAVRVVCAESDDVVNVQIALDVLEALPADRRGGLEIQAEASEASAATALLEAAAPGAVKLFSLQELWAWRLLAAGPLWRYRSGDDRPPDVVLLGAGPLAGVLLTCAARWWHFDAQEEQLGERLSIVVVDRDSRALCEEIAGRHPEMRTTVDLRALEADLADGLDAVDDAVRGDGRPWVAYVCLDASDAIRRAAARVVRQRLAASANGLVVVAVSTESARVEGTPPIEEVAAAEPGLGFDPSRLGRVERLARAIHGVYERHMRETGHADRPALKPFDQLRPEEQESNRAQARSVQDQLLAVLRTTAPLRDWSRVSELSQEDVELLSELEHIRWCSEKVAAGLTYGRDRDRERRQHPDLVPWAELSEESREINRAYMRRRPRTLARVGEAIVPHPAREELARLTHESYRASVDPSSPSWSELDEARRASSRAFVDDLPGKLRQVGRRLARADVGAVPFELTPEQVELLARREHESWAAFRGGGGRGLPGDSPEPHPDLVPWSELPKERREIDRVLVRATPAMLEDVGLAAVELEQPVPSRGAR